MSVNDLPITVSRFASAKACDPDGFAYGVHHHTTWGALAALLQRRREGEKDGPCFCASTSTPEADGRVRRLKANVTARTAIALDIETHKKTGEIPPTLTVAMDRVAAQGWAAVGYTSHNHQHGADIRYRLVLPMTHAIPDALPAPEVVAARLSLLGVLDTSKVGAASLFYLPSTGPGRWGLHQTASIAGAALDASALAQAAGKLQAARDAEAERIAAIAHAEAAARRAERLAAGFNPDDSLIERIRAHYDLAAVLAANRYDQSGKKFRHPNHSSGQYGADIAVFGGIERVFSHNASDPLHADNLPEWCGVTALDVVDVVTILAFGGDRRRALRELAERHGLNKAAERKRMAKLLFRLIKRRTAQADIEAAAYAEGITLGLSKSEVIQIANWVVGQNATRRRAA